MVRNCAVRAFPVPSAKRTILVMRTYAMALREGESRGDGDKDGEDFTRRPADFANERQAYCRLAAAHANNMEEHGIAAGHCRPKWRRRPDRRGGPSRPSAQGAIPSRCCRHPSTAAADLRRPSAQCVDPMTTPLCHPAPSRQKCWRLPSLHNATTSRSKPKLLSTKAMTRATPPPNVAERTHGNGLALARHQCSIVPAGVATHSSKLP